MPTPGSDPRERGSRLALHVALLVIAGVVLGLAYNQSMLLAADDRALSWIARERPTGVLELPATPSVATPASEGAPSATIADAPAPNELAANATRDTVKRATKAVKRKAAAKAAPAESAATTAKGAVKATAAKAGSKPAAWGPAVPAIPDTREPLEAKLDVVKALHAADAALFVDARGAEDYAAGHIAGAVNLPFDDVFKKPDLAKQLEDHGKPIVTYCEGGDCSLAKDLAFSLIDAGHRKVLFFREGLPGWKAAGGAVHTGTQP